MIAPQDPFDYDVELGSPVVPATIPSVSAHRRVFLEVPVSPGQHGPVPPSEKPTYVLLPLSGPTWPPASSPAIPPGPRAPPPSLGISSRTSRSTEGQDPEAVSPRRAQPLPISEIVGDNDSPPAYIATVDEVPPYSRVNRNPETLARYLFRHGFYFPPFWLLGASILVTNLNPIPRADLTAGVKTEAEYAEELEIIRATELKWAWRSLYAFVFFLCGCAAALSICWTRSH